jgi:hypothetical protein
MFRIPAITILFLAGSYAAAQELPVEVATVEELQQLVKSKARNAYSAAERLVEIAPNDPATLPCLMDVGQTDVGFALLALKLGKPGAAAIESLLRKLPTEAALALLAGFNTFELVDENFTAPRVTAPATVLAAVTDPDAELRQSALVGLRFVHPTPAVVKTILVATRDPDGHVRALAVSALGACKVFPEAVVSRLFEMASNDSTAGWDALYVLFDADVDANKVVSLMVNRLKTSQQFACVHSCPTIVKLGKARSEVVDALVARLEREAGTPSLDSESQEEAWAAIHFLELPPARRVPLMTLYANSPRAEYRIFGIMVLGDFGPAAASAVPVLERRLRDEDSGVADAAKTALERIRPMP